MWPSLASFYPHFPGRSVSVLNGTWEFAFLGEDGPLQASDLPASDSAAFDLLVEVPDAFDLRPNRPRCSECFPAGDIGSEEQAQEVCWRCCSRSFGTYGDPKCWWEQRATIGTKNYSHCCGHDPLRYRRGRVAYRTELPAGPGYGVLHFASCSFRCLVAVDGVFLMDHTGPSPFQVDVPPPQENKRTRSLVVLADNRFDRQTTPVHQLHYDWYQAGGLIRSVQFHSLPTKDPLYLAGVSVLPRTFPEVDVVVKLSPKAVGRMDLLYRYRFDDSRSGCADLDGWGHIEPGEGFSRLLVPNGQLWSPESPQLHRLKVAMVHEDGDEHLLDCTEVRFGLRTVATKGRAILLNGEPLKLFGVNRHEITDTAATTQELLVKDIELLKSLGANFVRGAHYPQDQRFLDLCDEHGLLVWEEVLGWQNTIEDFSDGLFMMQNLKMADEMVAASINHPSVIFFGFFNEGDSYNEHPAASRAYEVMAKRLRQRSGGTRLISWGSSAAVRDKFLAFADVCAFHLYPGWYPTRKPVDFSELQEIPLAWQAMADWVRESYPDKPFIVTEAGAGGLLGHRGSTIEKWTEEYQSLLMQLHYLSIARNDDIAGLALWQFADTLIDRNISDERHRPGGLNNKGLVGLDRQPKVAFHTLRVLRNQPEDGYFGLVIPPEDAHLVAGKLTIGR